MLRVNCSNESLDLFFYLYSHGFKKRNICKTFSLLEMLFPPLEAILFKTIKFILILFNAGNSL